MQFAIIGLDGTDEKAMDRRMAAREAHLKMGDDLVKSGNLWYASALLSDDGKMKGSLYVVDFPSEKEMRAWLKTEPYVVGNVWKDITIHRSDTHNPWQFNRPKEFYTERKK